MLNIDDEFVKRFIEKSQFVDGGATFDFTEIKKDFFHTADLKISFQNDAVYYFTSTGLELRVLTVHAIGDYAIFHLNYIDVLDNMRPKSQWEDIKVIRDQCLQTTLTGFGNTWFVSGFDDSSNGILRSFKFYLLVAKNYFK